jgi:hypothetical protein
MFGHWPTDLIAFLAVSSSPKKDLKIKDSGQWAQVIEIGELKGHANGS